MIMTNKNTEIILCSGIKMDKNYENVLSYSESDMVTLCRNNKIYDGFNYAIVQPNKTIDVACKYEDAIYANYMAFINPKYGNKWFFAWITNVELRNPNTTRITFQVDVFSTWYSRFNIGKAFIEREHVSDDTIGKHTIPENIETGEFIINSTEDLGDAKLNSKRIVIVYTGNPQSLFPSYGSGKEYTGLYTGYNYMVMGSSQDAESMIQGFADNGALEKIVALFSIPVGLLRESTHWYNGPGATGSDVVEVGDGNYPMFALVQEDPVGSHHEITILTNTNVNINTTLDGYTPKNNKLFTEQFNYLYVTNNTGTDIKLNYEDFINNQPIFSIIGAISIGCAIKLVPQNYKKLDTTNSPNALYTYGINASKYPTLGWVGDAYTNWLTQNAINLTAGFIGGGLSVVGGIASGNYMAAAGGLMDITNKIGQVRQHQMVSETGQGNVNAGDLTFSSQKMCFTFYKMSVRKEMAEVIDSYFSRFGYKVNEVKTPSLTSRTKFNFIKVGGLDELISGNIPAVDLEEINRVFRKGVTIFHNYSDIGNYTVTNSIVTP